MLSLLSKKYRFILIPRIALSRLILTVPVRLSAIQYLSFRLLKGILSPPYMYPFAVSSGIFYKAVEVIILRTSVNMRLLPFGGREIRMYVSPLYMYLHICRFLNPANIIYETAIIEELLSAFCRYLCTVKRLMKQVIENKR